MKKNILASLFVLCAAPAFSQSNFSKNVHATLGFTENKGQFADPNGKPLDDVLFKSTGNGSSVFITASGLTYVFHRVDGDLKKDDISKVALKWSKIDMQLAGATIKSENVICEDQLPGYSNYYYQNCPGGILQVKSWHKVTIRNVYPGIDWVLHADDQDGMAHDFIVHPGADASKIKIIYKGTDGKLRLSDAGKIILHSAYGDVQEGRLNVYEMTSGKTIAAHFEIAGNALHFSLGKFNANDDLLIDPPLQWASVQASSDFDYGYAVAPAGDGTGDVLVTGASDGTDFPVMNATQGLLYGFEDMVVFRLDASGTRLWSTYYGGTGYEQGKGIASDANGNCYVAGNTGSTDFPVQNATQASYAGGTYDVAILKLNAAGVRQWATWYGGLQNDYGTAITCDAAGNSYITGYTNSSTFPTVSAIQSSKNVSYDAFIMKMDPTDAVQWATFYGGNDDDKGRAITIDATGTNVYLTGSTLAGTFPVTSGVFQINNANAFNAEDAFIVKISSAQSVQFSTYCGGTDADFGQGITVDNSGKIFITGYTLSSDYPTVDPGGGAYFDNSIGSAFTHDAFVTECSSDGSVCLWSTYLGGTGVDMGLGIAHSATSGIYVVGNSGSTDFPVQQPSDNVFYQSVQGDGGNYYDMFIAWFGVNDDMLWSTYYGGANDDEANGVAVDANENIFVAGLGSNDINVLKFNPGFPLGVPVNEAVTNALIYPVPAAQTVYVNFYSPAAAVAKIEVLDVAGKCVLNENKDVIAGNNVFPLDISALAKGVYFVKLNDGKAEKFVKE